MTEPYPKLLVEVESHCERYLRVFGTPESQLALGVPRHIEYASEFHRRL
jgi:hypothetical protein